MLLNSLSVTDCTHDVHQPTTTDQNGAAAALAAQIWQVLGVKEIHHHSEDSERHPTV
jgi:hypothetical protein